MTVTLTRTGAAVHDPCYVEWCQLPNDHDSIHWHVDYPGKPPTEPPLIPKVEAARKLAQQPQPFGYGYDWRDLRLVYPDEPKAIPFTKCPHAHVADSRDPNGPVMSECPDCGLRWFLVWRFPERRPIPWGCFKMVHIGRHIRLPIIDR